MPALGFPGLTQGSPRFAYGSLGEGVARVVVAVSSGDVVEAEIVGEIPTHYVAILPEGVSPSGVIAFKSSGEELARRDFLDDEADHEQVEGFEQWCGETERGYECRGSARASGTVSGSGGVDEVDGGR